MPTSAKDRLLDETAALLWERGYTATSPRDVQLAAAVGQGSMYHHFSGKADLARHAIEAVAEGMKGEADDLIGTRTGVAALEAYLRKPRDSARGCRLGRLAQEPDVVSDDQLRAPIADYFAHLIGELASRLEPSDGATKEPLGVDPADLAASAVAAIQGAYVLARATKDPELFGRVVNGMASLLNAGRSSETRR